MEKWHLRFGITSNCNFRCSYCNSHNVYAEDMSEKDISSNNKQWCKESSLDRGRAIIK